MKDSHDSKHANRVCISAPFWGIGGVAPDVNTLCFKGKRQLSWSNGLKARFFVDEKTDEELAAEKDDRAVLLGLLTVDQWRDVLKVDGRGVLLDIAAKGGWHNVQRYLWLIEGAREGVQFDPELLQEARLLLTS